VVVSAAVAEAVRGRVPFALEDLGERSLKNIERPVRAFRIAAAGGLPSVETERPALPLPDRPSLVVLPFQNMGGDPEQDYFADGMVEDITTALSRIRWFFVIARNSAFTYRGRAVDVRQVGRELGVRYALEGSVRRAGGRLRIAAQLVEAETGRHVWAERFDGDAADVFDLQDRVTEAVAGAVEPSLQAAEVRRAQARPTGDPGAYELYLRALPCFRAATREGSDAALGLLRRAAALDPDFALARAFAAKCLQRRVVHGWSGPGEEAEAIALARSALDASPDDATALGHAGITLLWLGADRDRAVAALERAACRRGKPLRDLEIVVGEAVRLREEDEREAGVVAARGLDGNREQRPVSGRARSDA
jgi:adenylate cyclase